MRLDSVHAPQMRPDDETAAVAGDEWVSAPAAAKLLGLSSPNTLKNWVNGGHFPGEVSKTLGKHWRFRKADVFELLHRMKERDARNRRGDLAPPDLGDEEVDVPLL